MAEFRISGVTNGILSWVLAVEYFVTSTFGIICSAGGSLLLVARKLNNPDAVDRGGKSSVTKDHAESAVVTNGAE